MARSESCEEDSPVIFVLALMDIVIAWPLFMVLIILTSNFWSWRHKEWEGCSAMIKRRVAASIISLVIAVMVLTYSASLTL